MESKLDLKRIGIYLAIAFGLAWAVGLAVYLINENADPFDPNIASLQLTVTLLLAVGYMWAPALGNILTRLITREGWQTGFLIPHFRRAWKFWLLAWIMPVVLTVLGLAVYFLVFPAYFDSSLPAVKTQMAQAGMASTMSPWLFVGAQMINVLLVGLVVNSLATFGEEFGWRAYLLQKLMPLGARKAVLISGVIWGVWHWPLTAQGHNYGLNYPGAPWLGMLMMVIFTIALGTLLSWLALRAGSVWPAVIGHAIMNAVGGLGLIMVVGEPNMLFGPIPAGLVAGLPFILLALLILLSPKALQPAE